jgi:molybdate transport system substrate-binding protein
MRADDCAELWLLSAGAAQSVATALIPDFGATTGARIRATFGAVGELKEKLLAGERCDVLVSTAAMVDELARAGRIAAATIRPVGRVDTGIAVRSDEPVPVIGNREALRASLIAASGIYLPDPERATAGVHFVKVTRALGLYDALASRLHKYPNGASAMAALAASRGSGLIGCTQSTEIKATPGVALAGALPAPFDLSTLYVAAACTSAANPELAQRWIAMLAGAEASALRRDAGFEAA